MKNKKQILRNTIQCLNAFLLCGFALLTGLYSVYVTVKNNFNNCPNFSVPPLPPSLATSSLFLTILLICLALQLSWKIIGVYFALFILSLGLGIIYSFFYGFDSGCFQFSFLDLATYIAIILVSAFYMRRSWKTKYSSR